MSAHTPGPWKWVRVAKDQCVPEFTLRGPNVLCRYWYDKPPSGDAHLIAAAPDLLVALTLATAELNTIRARDGAPQHIFWHRGRPVQIDGCTHEWWNELTEKCESAIASVSPPAAPDEGLG